MRAAVGERTNGSVPSWTSWSSRTNYLGTEINVSGLLTGHDLAATLAGHTQGRPVYITSRAISDRTHTMLDDMTVADLSATLGSDVVPSLTFTEVASDLRKRQERAAA